MFYPVLTVVVGSIVAIISAISLFICARAGGIFLNQARFLACGILLILHFPLTNFLDGLILSWLEKLGTIDGSSTASYWAATAVVVAVQLIILPTSRELYATYMADRLTHRDRV
ncbi:hypothetical protein GCM10023063_18940 [Arthrobacter methylotrophus]|uniref:Uncharacterized protein n=1 Tax=Arthrobacter methylotrophus TaxID=121291 RepID=A0ABV5UQC3_9MICC